MAKSFAIVVGAGLTVAGMLAVMTGQLHYKASHDTLRLVSELIGLTSGALVAIGDLPESLRRFSALSYLLVALPGLGQIPAFVVSTLNLNRSSNRNRLTLGLLSFCAGFGAKQKPATVRP
jgi:hypothetical protein